LHCIHSTLAIRHIISQKLSEKLVVTFQSEAGDRGLIGAAASRYVAGRVRSLRQGGDLHGWLTDSVRSIYSDVVDGLAARAARKEAQVEPEAEAPTPTPTFDRWMP
jgi:hypothetical protein